MGLSPAEADLSSCYLIRCWQKQAFLERGHGQHISNAVQREIFLWFAPLQCIVSSLFLSWCRNGFQGPPVGSALLVRTEVQDPTAFRTCPTVSSARKTVGQRGKTRFEMCGSRSPSVENSSKSFSMYMKESW